MTNTNARAARIRALGYSICRKYSPGCPAASYPDEYFIGAAAIGHADDMDRIPQNRIRLIRQRYVG